jgi:hypothetical protein
MFSGFANGITMVDSWRLTADTNSGTNATVSSNWEQVDEATSTTIGTSLSESSGIFSFAQTGIYLIIYSGNFKLPNGDGGCNFNLEVTNDNGTYNTAVSVIAGNRGTADTFQTSTGTFVIDVTDTSNVKFRFATGSFSSGNAIRGNTSNSETHFSVFRLGDT